MAVPLSLHITPHGKLLLTAATDAPLLDDALAARLEQAFARGSGHGLLLLGADEPGTLLPPVFAFWREFGARYFTALCARRDIAATDSGGIHVPAPATEELERMAGASPLSTGAEYLTASVLHDLWTALDTAFRLELGEAGCGVQDFLKRRNPAWNLVGRVHFNLAENRKDEAAPFAFLATYTTRLSAQAKAQHLPLGRALSEYAGAANKEKLLSLLLPVQRASETCPWLKDMVESGEIFHPLRWTPQESLRLLRDVPALESAGVVVRMPASWSGNRPPRPLVTGTVGAKAPSLLGQDALLDFRMDLTLDGEPLTAAEIQELLKNTEGARSRARALDRSGPRPAAAHDRTLPTGRAYGQ